MFLRILREISKQFFGRISGETPKELLEELPTNGLRNHDENLKELPVQLRKTRRRNSGGVPRNSKLEELQLEELRGNCWRNYEENLKEFPVKLQRNYPGIAGSNSKELLKELQMNFGKINFEAIPGGTWKELPRNYWMNSREKTRIPGGIPEKFQEDL